MSRSYIQLLKTHPAEGWVKYRYAKTTEELEKVNRMHDEIRVLKEELCPPSRGRGSRSRRAGTRRRLGPNRILLEEDDATKEKFKVEATWDAVHLREVGQWCMDLPAEFDVRDRLDEFLSEMAQTKVSDHPGGLQVDKIQLSWD